jgi:hypothetical protein
MSKSIYLGIDDGHAMVNVYGEGDSSVTLHSRVRQGTADNLTVGTEPDIADGATITVNGNSYACGRTVNANFMDTRVENFPGSEQNIALIAYAVAVFFKGKIPTDDQIIICTGLPMGTYYPNIATMQPNKEVIERKNKALMESEIFITHGGKKQQIKFAEVITRPECMMAIYDEMIEESLKQGIERYTKRVSTDKFKDVTTCYLDIGGRTSDLVLFDGNNLIGQCSGSYEVGALTVADKVRDSLKAEHGEFSARRLDEMMKFYLENKNKPTEKFPLQRKMIDVIPVINQVLSQEIITIQNFINAKINTRADQIDNFKIFGGGTYLYRDLLDECLKDYPISWVESPELLNARSLYKFVRYGRK